MSSVKQFQGLIKHQIISIFRNPIAKTAVSSIVPKQ